jgi:hypothetical protein
MNFISAWSRIPEASDFSGYWTNGDKVIDVTLSTHITYIIQNPEAFGLSLGMIEKIFEMHGENIGVEGKAREEVIRLVSTNGWVRVRHYMTGKDYWSIQCDKIKLRLESIRKFIYWAIYDTSKIKRVNGKDKVIPGVMKKDDELHIVGYEDDLSKKEIYAWADGGAMGFFKAHPEEQRENKKKEVSN